MKRSTFFKSLLALFTLPVLTGFGKKEEFLFEPYPIKDPTSFKFHMLMSGSLYHIASGQTLKHKSLMKPLSSWKQRSYGTKEYNHVMLVHLEGDDKSPVTERLKCGSLLLNDDDTFWVVIDLIHGGVCDGYFAIKHVDGPKGVSAKSIRA